MKTQIDPEWMGLELQHRHGGDGWGIVEVLDDDYCRVTWPRAAAHNANRAFLAWVKLLSPMLRKANPKDPDSPMVKQPFNEDDMAHLESLREALASGKKKVAHSYIVRA